ncbi:MAG: dipeptidase [Actinobacteria bacterium]|nr:dipeptidase [Actinomycetota bacterium]
MTSDPVDPLRPANAEDVIDRLVEWLSIPSISAEPAHRTEVADSAVWLRQRCLDAGFTSAEIWETDGHPAVFARWDGAGDEAPTVLVYGHHDVQPVDPLEAWAHPPFEPVIVDGECRARGAIDDKGQVLYHVEAVAATLAESRMLPVNLKLLVEGEEEIGSPHFEQLLVDHAAALDCDVIVVSDTGMISPDIPSTDVAMRGLVAATIELTTSSTDLHSGSFGGTVPNAARHLSRLLANLHDDQLRVAVDGFYDDVVPLDDGEQRSLDEQPFDETEFCAITGVAGLEGELGRSPLERIGSRPTAEIVGMSGGYVGEGIKTIVPSRATAKIAFRLVPDQDPTEVMRLVDAWVTKTVPPLVDVSITWHGGVAPVRSSTRGWAFEAVSATIASIWGAHPLLTRVGGSGPEETIARRLGAPMVFLGVGLPGDRIHAPNERMVMDQFWRGFHAARKLYGELADRWASR